MITWNLTLSGQQIGLLKMFSERVDGREFSYRGREAKFGIHPNTIPGTRTLLREGLLVHREVRLPSGYIDVNRSGHFITERGRFILKMIETDVDKFLNVENQLTAKRAKGKVA